jgi:Mrp family chromosome partitioning ATPase
MTTFDQILPKVTAVLGAHRALIASIDWLLVNRDLNGRVRLIAPETVETDGAIRASLSDLAEKLAEELTPHIHPQSGKILFDASREQACEGAVSYNLSDLNNVWVVDRLATEANWTRFAAETRGAPRIVFFSIKGGVGRSTALAATAWSLAQAGKRVLVLDLDLESPGLSAALLPQERQPMYGITDWLVEDLGSGPIDLSVAA